MKQASKKPKNKQKQKTSSGTPELLVLLLCAALVITGIVLAVVSKNQETSDESGESTSATSQTDTTDTTDTADATDSTEDESALYTPAALREDATYFADIELQDRGTVTVRLDQKSAPITAANFVELANSGFYDGLTFHRIMEGFMMQGGDPEGDGTGGAEYNIKGEFSANGVENALSHTAGALSMARADAYNSASSQFFIVHEDSTFLDGEYAVFGYVTEGMDIVDAVCTEAEPTDGNGTIEKADQPVITKITIREE